MLVVGHRGYPLRYPENTIASLLAAVLHGADGVEFDVRLTADGLPVVVHDDSLERVAGVNVRVREKSYSEIARYSLGMGQHVPLLEDVLRALPPDTLLLVEVKEADAVDETYKLLGRYGRLSNTIVLSFQEEALRRMRSLDGKLRLGFNVESLEAAERAPRLAAELGLTLVNIPVEALRLVGVKKVRGYLSKLRTLGLQTGMWGVNDAETFRLVRDIVDVIITDNVEEIGRLAQGEEGGGVTRGGSRAC